MIMVSNIQGSNSKTYPSDLIKCYKVSYYGALHVVLAIAYACTILHNETNMPLSMTALKTFFSFVTLQEKLLNKTQVKPKERNSYMTGFPVATLLVTFLIK